MPFTARLLSGFKGRTRLCSGSGEGEGDHDTSVPLSSSSSGATGLLLLLLPEFFGSEVLEVGGLCPQGGRIREMWAYLTCSRT